MSHLLLYLEHLSDQDIELLSRVESTTSTPHDLRARLRARPALIETLLESPRLFEMIMEDDEADLAIPVTPFLVFAALVHQITRDLNSASYVTEWAGPGRRLPVFDVGPLREFLASPSNRFFLIELLTSFVRVASGSIWVQTRRGYRRRRYSELDPVRLAEVVDQLPVAQRPGGYRRLGDVTLFLSGVFPDHTATHVPAVSDRERLAVSAGAPQVTALDEGRDLRFHEIVGASWYRRAVETARMSVGAGPGRLLEVADQFGEARRVLNVLTDQYLNRYDSGLAHPAD